MSKRITNLEEGVAYLYQKEYKNEKMLRQLAEISSVHTLQIGKIMEYLGVNVVEEITTPKKEYKVVKVKKNKK